jgi:hypothetical protein
MVEVINMKASKRNKSRLEHKKAPYGAFFLSK